MTPYICFLPFFHDHAYSFQNNIMSVSQTVISFNSLNKYGQCAQYLEALGRDDQEPSLQLTLVTGAGRVSVSRRLLQLLSPLVREAVASLPVLATLQPLNIILLYTDTVTVNTMVELVLTRLNSVDTSGVQLNDELSLF